MLNEVVVVIFFFFKQKTAYEMRISDWSSDVCSSDLVPDRDEVHVPAHDAIIPDAGFLADSDVADDSAAGRDERAARDRRRYSAKGQDSDIGHAGYSRT